jgi:hypothetical protein
VSGRKYSVTLTVTRVTTYEADIEADSLEEAQEVAANLGPWGMTEVDEETVDMSTVVEAWKILGG